MFTVPLPTSLNFFDLQIPLDGVTYTLQFRWNVVIEAWFFSVLDETSQTQYIDGLCMRNGTKIAYNITGRPFPGFFVCFDTSGNGVDPGFDDLGARVILIYFEAEDLAALDLEAA